MGSAELYGKLWDLFGPAGAVLWVLTLVSLYLSLRNGIYLYLVEKDFIQKFQDIEGNDADDIKKFYHDSDNPLINIICEVVLAHAQHSQDIRSEVSYMFQRNFSGVASGLSYLRLISVIAPLLGLMGTMLGMIDVFRVVASSPVVDTTLFAQGIWEALTTTILGLAVAIPTLFFYNMLMLKVKRLRIEAVEHSYRAAGLFNSSCAFGQAIAQARGEHHGGKK